MESLIRAAEAAFAYYDATWQARHIAGIEAALYYGLTLKSYNKVKSLGQVFANYLVVKLSAWSEQQTVDGYLNALSSAITTETDPTKSIDERASAAAAILRVYTFFDNTLNLLANSMDPFPSLPPGTRLDLFGQNLVQELRNSLTELWLNQGRLRHLWEALRDITKAKKAYDDAAAELDRAYRTIYEPCIREHRLSTPPRGSKPIGSPVCHAPPTTTMPRSVPLIASSSGCPDQAPGTTKGGSASTGIGSPHDPNDLIGPAGFGAQRFIQPGTLPFEIEFENDPAHATAAAQAVVITNVLDTDFDLPTFQFTGFGFGSHSFTVPAGLTHYQTTIDLRPDGVNLLVPVTLDLNTATRTVTATFKSLDPLTRLVPDGINDGFLPVNNAAHDGEGFITYTVGTLAGRPSGTAITNQASIVFDINAPLDTPTTLNTLDVLPPTSTVNTLPSSRPALFTVAWSGTDDSGGSGIAAYDVFVSDNGGPFTPFQTGTTQTSATFTGVAGHTYGFYSVASDNVGHRQPTPSDAQATTTVAIDSMPPTSIVLALPAFEPVVFTLEWFGSDDVGGSGIATYDIFVSDNGGPFTAFLTGTTLTSADFTGLSGHTYGFHSVAVDNAGNRETTPTTAQATTRIDTAPPTSTVAALASFSPATFPVNWSGNDGNGSGVASYDVFVRDNGGPFTAFRTATTQTSAPFTGVNGHTYGFYSVAVDAVGNRQPTPGVAQATTTVDTAAPTSSVSPLPPSTDMLLFTVSWSGNDGAGGSGVASYDVFVSDSGGPFTAFLTGIPQTSAPFPGDFGHTYRFFSVATDLAGNRETAPGTPQATIRVNDLPDHSHTSAPAPAPAPAPPPPPVSAASVAVIRQGKKGKTKKVAVVQFSDGSSRQIPLPFPKPGFSPVVATLIDGNGDGRFDTLSCTARKGAKKVSQLVLL